MNRVEAALALVAERLWPGPGTSPHATPLAEAVYRALEAIADEQTKTDALLREMIKARPDLAREKADAVPQTRDVGTGDWATVSLSEWFRNAKRGEVAEKERDAALRRAEAAEKERDEAKVSLTAEQSRREEAARLMREANRDCGVLEVERDALRADCERLSKLHEQDKAELVRWRKAAIDARHNYPRCPPDYLNPRMCAACAVNAILDVAEKP